MNDVREVTTQELQKGLDRDNGLHLLNVQAYTEGLEGWKAAGKEIVSPEPAPAA